MGTRAAGQVLGGEGKKPSPGKAGALGPRVPHLADPWARVHLARLCAALLLAEWTSAGEFAAGVGAPLLRMLVLLATRCAPLELSRMPLPYPCWARQGDTQFLRQEVQAEPIAPTNARVPTPFGALAFSISAPPRV